VKTIEEKNKYIQDCHKHEGILLKFNKIADNPGLRCIMKLLLNNFWGRFAMSLNKSQYKIITDLAEWIQLVSDPEYKVTSTDYTNKKYLQVHYRNTNLKQRSPKNEYYFSIICNSICENASFK
jgi:hypothetical protein